MNTKTSRAVILITGLIIGIFIVFLPYILTRSWFQNDDFLAELYITDYILKTLSPAMGLFVIYDAVKFYFK
ncbi:hypothetical protein FL966_06250 [Caproiciproducens galactitolivorans]|uniref:Uncharacterized protein n=1 Tax=Caproiciproducens galactitolivorans TaxID=642589 RepID=A0A4Z0Y985_9FIRM|nr:hypothetical protein [Caproiciproducens galactitolivorans]QEY34688.1 hypothetical protein FL966_06250 [Caproiciproducens galactitolivorans]TGJ75841.1 hypothetical protein CAGA_20480 [Caproiciproducens galactitolivorans]